jgi:UDPglucose 6-dehydrogenase
MVNKVKVVGYGVVGSALVREFRERGVDPVIYDPAKGFTENVPAEIAFLCVPTEKRANGGADLSLLNEAVFAHLGNSDVVVIKSTVPPGTCRSLDNRRIVFSPEFVGATPSSNYRQDFVILGGSMRCDTSYGHAVAELYKSMYNGSFKIVKTSYECAELVKYASNSWLAMQVVFFAEYSQFASSVAIDPDEFREMLLLDQRISRSHSFTFREHPYYDSHCLNKDLPAIVHYAESEGLRLRFIERIIETNEEKKCEHIR